ncbi:hypothetical protein U27_06033 [Candidatus Vecturithrix granuli]|uniref:Uncharacterized protein n=1 Tax=Vecturithrix granuli TaxID=1499967 RepID=A0A081C3A2_VECG1|nr:hypothetical protein U27_06033 [Candidatus Vecturithrix granuli]
MFYGKTDFHARSNVAVDILEGNLQRAVSVIIILVLIIAFVLEKLVEQAGMVV